MFSLISSTGRIGDRCPGLVQGATLTAEALKSTYEVQPVYVGSGYQGPAEDNWPEALAAAQATLVGLQDAADTALRGPGPAIFAINTCSASIATLPVAARLYPDLKVYWVDAHGDFNTPETTSSGYLGGMALAAACGIWNSGYGAGIKPTNVTIVGIRDIDAPELQSLRDAGVSLVNPDSTAQLDAIPSGTPIWIHIDWDVLEPGYIPADYSVPKGLTPVEVRNVLNKLSSAKLIGLELAEFQASGDIAIDQDAVRLILETIAPALPA